MFPLLGHRAACRRGQRRRAPRPSHHRGRGQRCCNNLRQLSTLKATNLSLSKKKTICMSTDL